VHHCRAPAALCNSRGGYSLLEFESSERRKTTRMDRKNMVYSHWSQHCYMHHPNITEHSLRRCQYCRAFIAPLPTFWDSSVHCAKQITNLFIGPLPTAVCRGSQRDVVYLGWSIGPSFMSPNARGRGEVAGFSQ
jgi:hypothetical protein